MIHRAKTILRRLYELPPKEVVHQIRRRLNGKPGDISLSPKTLRPSRPYDFLSRYQRILARVAGWEELDFSSKDVLEIGAGPFAFFGPLAVFLGARSYTSIDPDSAIQPFAGSRLVDAYLKPMHSDLVALYGERMSFQEFLEAVRARVVVRPVYILDAKDAGSFDIVLSNSCLEHVFPLEESLAQVTGLMRPGARYLHLVNFGNHLPTPSPFSEMYDLSREEYWARNRKTINLARLGDMHNAFLAAGLNPTVVPVSTVLREDRFEPRSKEWALRSEQDLWTRTALFSGTRA